MMMKTTPTTMTATTTTKQPNNEAALCSEDEGAMQACQRRDAMATAAESMQTGQMKQRLSNY
jgi:hypothetical protein